MSNVNVEAKKIYIWVPSVTVDFLLVWWWGAWGRGVMGWWGGWWWGWVIYCTSYDVAKWTYCIKIWAWWTWNCTDTLAECHSWCLSCFWDMVAYGGWGWWPWINSTVCCFNWASGWSWWGGWAFTWCCPWGMGWYWYASQWNNGWISAAYESWWWGWWYAVMGKTNTLRWGMWWCWLCVDISWSYARYWWWGGGWWCNAGLAQDRWWVWWGKWYDWCNSSSYWWWGGWAWMTTSCTVCKKWGNGCQGVFILKYPTACWYSVSWWTTYTSWNYTIHCFTSDWTLTIN